MSARRCAFLSMDDLARFRTDEQLVVPHMETLGWVAEEVSWRSESDWSLFDLVVIRSTWDYQADSNAFLTTLARIAKATHLENSLDLCRWNLVKTYLEELREGGIAIVPTRWSDAGVRLEEGVFDEFGCDEIVVKPVVSANADFTFRISRSAFHAHAQTLAEDFSERAYMVQPFLRSVIDKGEYSLIYFDGEYSHAVIKSPRAEDFRVQEEHGGEIRSVIPSPVLRDAGDAVLATMEETPLYARVDMVVESGQQLLMELELIEPSLFFKFDEASPARFAAACSNRWNASQS